MGNRLDQREGTQTTSAQRLGRAADTLHTALIQSIPAGPGKAPVIRVFPAWPTEWDADYTLLCRGGFLVSSSIQKGCIEFVGIQSQYGGVCRLRNPWGERNVSVFRNGRLSESLSGSLLEIDTAENRRLMILPAGMTPDEVKYKIVPQ